MAWQLVSRKWGSMQKANALGACRARTNTGKVVNVGLELPAQSPSDAPPSDASRLRAQRLNQWESEGGMLAPSAADEASRSSR